MPNNKNTTLDPASNSNTDPNDPAKGREEESDSAKQYTFELLFEETPKIDFEATVKNLEAVLGEVESKKEDSSYILGFQDSNQEGETPSASAENLRPQISLSESTVGHTPKNKAGEESDLLEESKQSWGEEKAGDIVSKTKFKMLLSDHNMTNSAYRLRHDLLSKTLSAFVQNSNCIGISCRHSMQIVSADRFSNNEDSLLGFINVRFFNAGEQGLIMDSLGLSALGLFDIQCHFQNMDPNELSVQMYNIAYYIFNKKPDFKNGHTVEGLNKASWPVQFEDAIVEPERTVLDINPGAAFAAGDR